MPAVTLFSQVSVPQERVCVHINDRQLAVQREGFLRSACVIEIVDFVHRILDNAGRRNGSRNS